MISGFCWNARGISNKGTISYIKTIFAKHAVSFCAILEPKANCKKITSVARKVGLNGILHCHPLNSHIWIFYKDPLNISVVSFSEQHITCLVKHNDSDVETICSVVYASNNVVNRAKLWSALAAEGDQISGSWVLMGDFNAVTSLDEKAGGRRFGTKSMNDFSNFILTNGLTDVGYTGNKYTWCNNQAGNRCIWMRLDRVLLNGTAAASFPMLKVTHLPRVKSDHCPLLVSFSKKEKNRSFFSFNPAWIHNSDFLPFVTSIWAGDDHPDPMKKCHTKLKRLRHALRNWNWEVFGDINQKIAELAKRIEATEFELQQNWNQETEQDLSYLQKRLNDVLADQQVFLEAKSHVNWLKDGDRNTKLFHAAAKIRRTVNNFKVTLEDGSVSDDREIIGNQAASFFQNLLGQFSATPDTDYFDDIRPSISPVDNDFLSASPSDEEIWCAVQNLPKDSAPGPDGFNGAFYHECWSIIGTDVSNAIKHFFKGFSLPSSLSATVLTLIPKEKNVVSLDKVRPISLCNYIHKIISKILNDRLRPLLSKLISEEQFGFIPGRSIHHCIAMAHDLVSDIDNKVHGGNVVLKLDMSKAYDRVSWLFLIRAMKALGFSNSWCDLIYRNISNCWYSIRTRGESFGYFKSNRGLRQGDPLSPSLFIIAMEIFSRKLNKAGKIGGGVMPYWSSLRALEVNHILYADDILVFSNGGKRSFSNLLNVLDGFCRNSGQVLQASKCNLFFSKHIRGRRRDELLRLSGYSPGKFPIRYLGAPLFHGQPRLSYFQGLVDAVKNRLEGWMKGFLSMAGRLTLIKSVLCSIPIHTLSVLPVPKGTLDAIEKLLRSFLWGSGSCGRRHWVNWTTICTDFQSGGLGIKPFRHMMTALRGKLAWSYLCNDSLWSKHARSRYTIDGKGSHLWSMISPYITSIAHDCYWRLGNGSTPVYIFCQNIGIPFPRKLKSISIKDALSNPAHRRVFMHNVHPRVFQSINLSIEDNRKDCLIWSKDPSGTVTTKSFWKSISPPSLRIPKFDVLWQAWIPLKISCFLWKVLHRALPTNDNVMRIGVSMASKCVCCDSPDCETMDHLFIRSNWATTLWDFLCPLFNRQRPLSIANIIFDWGINVSLNSFADCLGLGLVSICLWDIWKIRNEKVFAGLTGSFNKGSVLKAASSLAKCIPIKCRHDFKSRVICHPLHISVPLSRDFVVCWRAWSPCLYGLSCNLAVNVAEDRASIAAIIRNPRGEFVSALKIATNNKHFIKCLFHFSQVASLRGISFSRIQSDHEDICLLDRNGSLDWKLFPVKRRLGRVLKGVGISRVSHALNKPALALCHSSIEDLNTSVFLALPCAVQRALEGDLYPQPVSRRDQHIYL